MVALGETLGIENWFNDERASLALAFALAAAQQI